MLNSLSIHDLGMLARGHFLPYLLELNCCFISLTAESISKHRLEKPYASLDQPLSCLQKIVSVHGVPISDLCMQILLGSKTAQHGNGLTVWG